MECLYRINCGGGEYVDREGMRWLADQAMKPGAPWGAVGGNTTGREATLPIADAVRPEVYRSERFGDFAYEFALPAGTYAVRLHMAETFDSNFHAGLRVWDVRINGLRVLRDFDVYVAGGGFARPAVREFGDLPAIDGKLRVAVAAPGVLNGIEVFRQSALAAPARRLERILFVGNSHCFFWALPETLEQLINFAPTGLHIDTARHLTGGKHLDWHWDQNKAADAIREGRFDTVVVQSLRMETPGDGAMLNDYMGRYAGAVRAAGGRLMMYCTWPRSSDPAPAYDAIINNSLEATRKVGATFVPSAAAWRKVLSQRKDLPLHNADTVHSGMHGAYLTACCFYAVLSGKSPENHPKPAVLAGQVAIEPATARYLEKFAWETVGEYRA